MFTQTDLDRLIDAMRANGVTSLVVDTDDDVLELALTPAGATTNDVTSDATTSYAQAKSPCIGRFVPRGLEDGLTALDSGSKVQAGETLGYIAQGLVRAVINAPANGTLAAEIPKIDTVFGFGDAVFNLEVSG